MKRLLSLILIFLLGLNLCMFTYAEDQNVNISNFKEEKNFLNLLDISGSSVLDKAEITRGEFVAYTVNLLYPDNIFDSKEEGNDILFSDVDGAYVFFDEIRAAKSLGIIRGTSDMLFKPDDVITFNDAVVVMVNALGYSYYAQANGGYPAGYLFAASQIALTKGVANVSGNLDGNIMAKLIYNALFVDEIEYGGVSNGGLNLVIKPDSNLLSSKYKIYKYDAQVIRTKVSTIDGEVPCSDDTVVLETKDGKKLTVFENFSGIGYELGKKVTVYIRMNDETGKNEVVTYRVYKNSVHTLIKSETVTNVTGSYIECENETGKYIKYKTETRPVVIFNGVYMSVYDNSVFTAEDALLTLIDNDGNGIYEIINVLGFNFRGELTEYGIVKQNYPAWNIVVDYVDAENKFITCKWNPSNNITLSDEDALYTIISKDGYKKTLDEISSDSVISVAMAPGKVSGKNYYILAVSDETKSDTLTSWDGTQNKLFFDEEEKKVSSSIYKIKGNYINNLSLNSNVNTYIDYIGNIAYFVNLQKSSNNYAYLISAAVRADDESYLLVKVLEKTGTISTYKVSDKVKIDGVSFKGKTASDAYNALIKRPDNYGKWIDTTTGQPYENGISRPLIIKVNNEDLITEIDTDVPNYAKNLSGKPNLYTSQTPIGYSEDEISDLETLKGGYRSYRIMDYNASEGTCEGRFFVTSNTYVFSVPDIDTSGLSYIKDYVSNPSSSYITPKYDILKLYVDEICDENYKVVPSSSIINGMVYDIQGYNIDPDTGIAELVVLRGMKPMRSGSNYTSNMSVYLRRTDYYDQSLEKNITKIYFTSDGKTESSALVDLDNMAIAYDYVINGRRATDEDNIYEMDIPALKEGDLIRVSSSNGYLNHLERVVILDNLEDMYSTFGDPYTNIGYANVINKNRRMCDVNNNGWYGNTNSNLSFIIIPKTIKGDVIQGYMGVSYPKSMVLSDPSTYIDQYIKMGTVTPLLITIKDTGIETDIGDASDIKTIDETGDVLNASRIIYRHNSFKVKQLIIINDERGI